MTDTLDDVERRELLTVNMGPQHPSTHGVLRLELTLDGEVVPFSFAGVESGRTTWGHRFLSKGPIEVRRYEDYVKKLHDAHVIVDAAERKEIIRNAVVNGAFALGLEPVPAVVLEEHRRAVLAGQVLVAPAHQADDHRVEVAARIGKPVLVASRVFGVLPPLQDPGGDQRAEAGGERVSRGAGPPDHLVEPAVAEEHLAHR